MCNWSGLFVTESDSSLLLVNSFGDDHLTGSPASGDTDERFLVQTNVRLDVFGVPGEEIII